MSLIGESFLLAAELESQKRHVTTVSSSSWTPAMAEPKQRAGKGIVTTVSGMSSNDADM